MTQKQLNGIKDKIQEIQDRDIGYHLEIKYFGDNHRITSVGMYNEVGTRIVGITDENLMTICNNSGAVMNEVLLFMITCE